MNERLEREMVVQLCFGGSNIDLDLAVIVHSTVASCGCLLHTASDDGSSQEQDYRSCFPQ
jgi:hypothetical protein